jgi:hypothetical protein
MFPFGLLELATASESSSGFVVSGKTNPFEIVAPCLASVFKVESVEVWVAPLVVGRTG